MKNNIPLEIERKFLIRYPDTDFLSHIDGVRKIDIIQTYLKNSNESARVRKCTENGTVTYIKTVKKKISDLTRLEEEFLLSSEEYEIELKSADSNLNSIIKTRYKIPYGGHVMEIDIYKFWKNNAILEIELASEDEEYSIAPYVEVICEVSFDKRYTNRSLARSVPDEVI